MKIKERENILKKVLKNDGLERASEGFAIRLKNTVFTQFRLSYSQRYRKKERLGKWIIGTLGMCCLLILQQLDLFHYKYIIFIPVFFFLVGFWLIIGMINKRIT